MTTGNTSSERATSLVRTIAGSLRPLDEDLNLSPLQAIDRLQKLDAKFAEHWYSSPWLVLEDSHPLPANMPVDKMLAEIKKHGQPIGVVGVARITARQDSVLEMNFRTDTRSRKIVGAYAQKAKALIDKANDEVRKLIERSIPSIHGGQE